MAGVPPADSADAAPPTRTPSKRSRPAEPHATNAPLCTPRGRKVVSYAAPGTPSASQVAVDASDVPPPTTTTAALLDDACAHLIRVDPRMQPLIARHRCRMFTPEGLAEPVEPFHALCNGIMAQQVSGAAASAIKRRFVALFHDASSGAAAANGDQTEATAGDNIAEEALSLSFPTPEQVAEADLARLRTAGLSARKAEYIQGLAEKFTSGELSAQMLVQASYDEVLEKLTAVRGLGRWSVEMFACFALKRMDVFSTGDLGVQYGLL